MKRNGGNVHILWGFEVQSVHELVLRKNKFIESVVEFALKCFFFLLQNEKNISAYIYSVILIELKWLGNILSYLCILPLNTFYRTSKIIFTCLLHVLLLSVKIDIKSINFLIFLYFLIQIRDLCL